MHIIKLRNLKKSKIKINKFSHQKSIIKMRSNPQRVVKIERVRSPTSLRSRGSCFLQISKNKEIYLIFAVVIALK